MLLNSWIRCARVRARRKGGDRLKLVRAYFHAPNLFMNLSDIYKQSMAANANPIHPTDENNKNIILPGDRKKIIIDTDLSLGEFGKDVDDELALIMAINSPELEVLTISAVYGNTALPKVWRNLHEIANLFSGRKAFPELIKGAPGSRAWREKWRLKGIRRLADLIQTNPHQIILVPIGP